MAVFKCKMCGGELEIKSGSTVAECTYCGAKQTLPKLDDDKRFNLYDRANHFRRNNEFDKAMGIYENILNEDRTDAEAYWSLVLCRYGIEYVKDPASHKMVPTVNRAQFTSIYDDEDYKAALKYADSLQRQVYEAEAAAINEIQKGILEISQKEEPFDVFICYKETDQNGRRTQDSVLANELYHELTNEGFKVFFARITLEDKLGTAYEPYIFAALNSAKVMVVLGTKAEYFNAVWVKNEWSRYLSLIKSGAKKTLIPAYRDMDPYDLPEEFSHLQAQDMSKLGFMPDLVRGIKKLAQTEPKASPVKETVVIQGEGGANVTALIKRGNLALEDGDFDKANEFFDRALDLDAECGDAYMGQFLVEKKCATLDEYVKAQTESIASVKDDVYVACHANNSFIEACIQKYTLDGYLSEKSILKLFSFSLKYSSNAQGRRLQLESMTETLNEEKLLNRAARFGKQTEVDHVKEAILSVFRQNLAESEKRETEAKNSRIEEYEKFLAETEKKAIEMRDAALQKKAADEKIVAEKAEKERIEAEKKAELEAEADYLYNLLILSQTPNRITYLKETKEKTIKELQLQITALEEKKTVFLQTTEKLGELQKAIPKLNEQKQNLVEKIGAHQTELSSMGIFAGSKKKELKEKITTQTAELATIEKNLEVKNSEAKELEAKVNSMDSGTQIQEKISALNARISREEDAIDTEIDELETKLRNEKQELSVDEIIGRIVDNTAIKAYIKSNKSISNLPNAINEKLGFSYIFGHYPQSKDGIQKPIEWLILDKKDNQRLLLSKYGLDVRQYNDSPNSVTWETCSLRKWLNETFMQQAFSKEEQLCIQNSIVPAHKNPKFETNPGQETEDRVFLLSIDEVEKYVTSVEDRKCEPSDYAVEHGAYVNRSFCWWWLRSPGYRQDSAASVNYGGSVRYYGDDVSTDRGCVRPALWINLDS